MSTTGERKEHAKSAALQRHSPSDSPMETPMPAESIVCEVPVSPDRGPRVVLDLDRGTVTFIRCFREDRFWSFRNFRPEVVCALSEVRSMRSTGAVLWINTTAGRAYIPERRMTNVGLLRAHLERVTGGETGPGLGADVGRGLLTFLVIPFAVVIAVILVWIAAKG